MNQNKSQAQIFINPYQQQERSKSPYLVEQSSSMKNNEYGIIKMDNIQEQQMQNPIRTSNNPQINQKNLQSKQVHSQSKSPNHTQGYVQQRDNNGNISTSLFSKEQLMMRSQQNSNQIKNQSEFQIHKNQENIEIENKFHNNQNQFKNEYSNVNVQQLSNVKLNNQQSQNNHYAHEINNNQNQFKNNNFQNQVNYNFVQQSQMIYAQNIQSSNINHNINKSNQGQNDDFNQQNSKINLKNENQFECKDCKKKESDISQLQMKNTNYIDENQNLKQQNAELKQRLKRISILESKLEIVDALEQENQALKLRLKRIEVLEKKFQELEKSDQDSVNFQKQNIFKNIQQNNTQAHQVSSYNQYDHQLQNSNNEKQYDSNDQNVDCLINISKQEQEQISERTRAILQAKQNQLQTVDDKPMTQAQFNMKNQNVNRLTLTFDNSHSALQRSNENLTLERVHHNNRYWQTACSAKALTTGLHKWSVKINEASVNVVIGVITDIQKVKMDDYFIGKDDSSWGYRSGNGYKVFNGQAQPYGKTFLTNDWIEVILDLNSRRISFSKGGQLIAVAFSDLPANKNYYAAVSLGYKGDKVSMF